MTPMALVMLPLALLLAAPVQARESEIGTFEIAEVLVVGVATRRGLKQASPAVYFTLFKVEERLV